jgi:hypothetical protein
MGRRIMRRYRYLDDLEVQLFDGWVLFHKSFGCISMITTSYIPLDCKLRERKGEVDDFAFLIELIHNSELSIGARYRAVDVSV